MSEAIELRQTSALSTASTQRTLLTKEMLAVDVEQRKLLAEYVSRLMVKGVDFGEIPGTNKPTLLKPGAEKLVDLFRCTPQFKLMERAEDFERGFFNYMFRCRLVQRDTGAVLAEGYGSANSREGRYRWRNANRRCPQCGKETIIKGKEEYGGGWLCFAKKGGCNAKFRAGDKSIEGQEHGQVENEDIATLANTILKMAKKRALVDGSIALARCSDMFTQDVEDFVDAPAAAEEAPRVRPQQAPQAPPAEEKRAAPPPPKASAAGEPSEMEKLAVGIAEADSPRALLAVGQRIKQAQQANAISKAEREELATLYGAKQKDLRGGK